MKCACRVKAACKRWNGIHLVDKCLLVILTLLILQSAINLFLHETANSETNVVDVVIRTSAASIFGYLISVNFNQHRKRNAQRRAAQGNAPQQATGGTAGVTAQIGFHDGGGGENTVPPPPVLTQEGAMESEHGCDHAQILVVAAVGVVSLVILLIFRNFMEATPANAGSLTQFRDFVSGSVGFLISCSTSGVGGNGK